MHFSLGSCHAFKNADKLFVYLDRHCQLLESIQLSRMKITDTYAKVFTQGCKLLKSISFFEIEGTVSDSFLKHLGTNCHLLESFNCANNGSSVNNVGDDAMKMFASGCPLLRTFRFPWHTINMQGMRSLVEYCPLIITLEVGACLITDECLEEIGKLHNTLVDLDLSWSADITDEGIASLFQNAFHLLEECCDLLTDASCTSIANACPKLKSVYLTGDEEDISLLGLICLLDKCKGLINLEASLPMPSVIENELKRRKNGVGKE